MTQKFNIQKTISQSAEYFVKQGKMPTIELVLKHIKNIHSYRTVQKYLTSWKLDMLKRAVNINIGQEGSVAPEINIELESKVDIKQQQQQQQIDKLNESLLSTEKLNLQLITKNRQLHQNLDQLTEQYKNLLTEHDKVSCLYQEIKQERESTIKLVLSDKNHKINNLREEIIQTNSASKQKFDEIRSNAHDSLIHEKVKVINLEEKCSTMSNQLKQMSVVVEKHKQTKKRLQLVIGQFKQFIKDLANLSGTTNVESREC